MGGVGAACAMMGVWMVRQAWMGIDFRYFRYFRLRCVYTCSWSACTERLSR